MREVVNVNEIIIPEGFSEPKKEKLDSKRIQWNSYGGQNKSIVINKENVLLDGYIQYLLAKEFGCDEVYVKRVNIKSCKKYNIGYRDCETAYIYGKHMNSKCDKEFVWRLKNKDFYKKDLIKIGDIICVNTKFGLTKVVVRNICVLNEPPVDQRVKCAVVDYIFRDEEKIKL